MICFGTFCLEVVKHSNDTVSDLFKKWIKINKELNEKSTS